MGGAVFTIFAAIYYWFPKITGRMLSEGLGRLSFGLMFVGFLATFLIQHVIGLDGMPRRVYEYDNVGHLALYNVISTVGSFILAAGVLVTIVNVARSLKVGAVAGPDPWKANTLEWFTTSPPPANNFDVVPLVRSAEPMKDIRREVERRSSRAGAARARHGARRGHAGRRVVSAAPPTGAAPALEATALGVAGIALRARASSLSDYVELTKPKVQSLLLLTTIATMYVAGRPLAGARGADLPRRLPLGGRRGRRQPLVRPRHRRADGAHRDAPDPGGAGLAARGADVRLHARAAVAARALADGQPARGGAVVLGLPRLRASSTPSG